MFLFTTFVPDKILGATNSENEDLITVNCATCDYKYWKITSTTRIGKEYKSKRNYIDEFETTRKGQQHFVNISYKQKATWSGSFSVTWNAVGVSLGFTPGNSYSVVSVGTTSGPTKKGEVYRAYYQEGQDKYKVNQAEYHYKTGKSKATGKKKTGYAYQPKAGKVTWVKVK